MSHYAGLHTDLVPIPVENWQRVSGSLGSTAGGVFLAPGAGDHYLKFPVAPEQARSEVLACCLYGALGILVPEMRLATRNGTLGTVSPWRLVRSVSPDELAGLQDTFDGFAADVWLANYDVASAGNLVLDLETRRAIRLDLGGALRFRPRGGLKIFGPRVFEIDMLRAPAINPAGSMIFGRVSLSRFLPGARRLADLPDQRIEEIVARHFPRDDGRQLASILVSRKQSLIEQLMQPRRDS